MSKARNLYFKSTDSIFQRFQNYEIHPCSIIGKDKLGEPIYEQCNHDSRNIAIWCVYGRFFTGGLECISDHDTEIEAEMFEKELPSLPVIL